MQIPKKTELLWRDALNSELMDVLSSKITNEFMEAEQTKLGSSWMSALYFVRCHAYWVLDTTESLIKTSVSIGEPMLNDLLLHRPIFSTLQDNDLSCYEGGFSPVECSPTFPFYEESNALIGEPLIPKEMISSLPSSSNVIEFREAIATSTNLDDDRNSTKTTTDPDYNRNQSSDWIDNIIISFEEPKQPSELPLSLDLPAQTQFDFQNIQNIQSPTTQAFHTTGVNVTPSNRSESSVSLPYPLVVGTGGFRGTKSVRKSLENSSMIFDTPTTAECTPEPRLNRFSTYDPESPPWSCHQESGSHESGSHSFGEELCLDGSSSWLNDVVSPFFLRLSFPESDNEDSYNNPLLQPTKVPVDSFADATKNNQNQQLSNTESVSDTTTESKKDDETQENCSSKKFMKSNGSNKLERLHAVGRCKPCAFFYNSKRACKYGELCGFCHHEDHAQLTLKQWKKHVQRLNRLGDVAEAT